MDSNLICLSDMLDDPDLFKLPDQVAAYIAWENRLTLLAGREKAGKSTLVASAAARISQGEPFIGKTTGECGKVLWVSYEETVADIGRRFLHFGGDPDNLFMLIYPDECIREVLEACETHDFSLIVWDSLATIANATSVGIPDPGNSGMWIRILSPILQIAHEYAASVLIHHARKSDGKYRDSTAIGSVPDVIVEMMERKNNERLLKRRGRYGNEDYLISWDGKDYSLIATGALDKRIVEFVREHPKCTWGDLRDGVKGRADDIKKERDRLLETGAIINSGSQNRHIYEVFHFGTVKK